jgi:hypothetical protein
MGAEAWSYFVPYREEIGGALEDLKQREFEAGRYLKPNRPHLAPSSIDEVLKNCEASGTRSILDMVGVADVPRNPEFRVGSGEFQMFEFEGDPMFGLVAPLTPEQIVDLFGTERPSREMIERNPGCFELIDRGLGLYLVAYDGDTPSELFFAGYSFD